MNALTTLTRALSRVREEKVVPALFRLGIDRTLNLVGIDIVHGCQLRCVGCPNSLLKPHISFMSPIDFDSVLDNVGAVTIKRLRLFNYGEPLLHPQIADILTRIKKRKSPAIGRVIISTNAQHHDFTALGEMLKVGNLYSLTVSCDGDGTKETYERLRPPAKFDKLVTFLAKARELRDRYSPHTLLLTTTICETDAGKRRWHDILDPLGWAPSFRGWYRIVGSLKAAQAEEETSLLRGCAFMRSKRLFVDADGTVVPCCSHPRAFELGNLISQKYSEILFGNERRMKLRELRRNRQSMPVCRECVLGD